MDSTFSFPAELTAPFELRGELPRRALLTGNGVQMVLATALLLGLASASAMWAGMTLSRHERETAALRSEGQVAIAQIKRVSTAGSLEPRVIYVFTANGVQYTAESRMPKSLVKTLAHPGPLSVRYLPGNPAINHPVGWQPAPHSDLALLIAPTIAALLGLSLLIPLSVERRMAAHGKPALAIVKKCTRARSGYLVSYEFRPEGGPTINGRGWHQVQQEAGEGIWVLYLPSKPRKNLLYPLSYCKVIDWGH